MDFKIIIDNIKDKNDFIKFIELLLQELKGNSEFWENKDLESYLNGLAGWTEDMEQYYFNNNLPIPENINWKVFADILIAASMYE